MKYNFTKLLKARPIHLFLALFLLPLGAMAQTISGTVKDSNGEAVLFANVVEKGTTNGSTTGEGGAFSLNVSELPATLVVSSVGYNTVQQVVSTAGAVTIVIQESAVGLDEIVVTGNRAKARTILDSPVPIDNIGVEELITSGKPTIERMLTFKVPSFNSQNQAISDATAHYDPADLRGLGPSRTLVLVNGKRKNQSAQVYLNRTPGKGEVGIDLKSIPIAAIERVEVLRDGAAAQYGSDAIAGVINMILKKDVEYSTFSAKTGITSEGDGFNFATDFNTGLTFGKDGYLNLTLGYYKQEITNRAGEPGVKDLPDNPRANWFNWATENPDLGMHVGQPELEKGDVFVNMSHPIGENAEFYSFHGLTVRKGQSFAYYRAPYWRQGDVGDLGFITRPEDFIGYQPTFETKIKDNINAMGFKFDLNDSWKADLSATYGANAVDYTVNNSVNRDYLKDHGTSPRTFHPGGYSLSNLIGNFDVSGLISNQISVALGLELKKENFKAFEGNPLSYYKGGSDSFAGIKPDEAGEWDRNSFAAYAQLDYDISDAILIGFAGRFEDFSDFGSNFSWKVNGRYKIGDNGAIRAAYSTGFRAPTLHQRYLTNSQYIIVSGSSEPLLQGTLANDNAAVKALGVPSLFAETSKNLTVGLTYKFNNNLSASVDFYQINVADRVLFSSQIGALDGTLDGSDAVEQILVDNNVVAVQFFINAGDTKTTGADIVLNYRGDSGFGANFAANFNTTTLDAINTPAALAAGGYNIFDRQEQGLIINSRPKSKFILGLTYDADKWNVGLNNILFGKVTITHPESGGIDQDLASKLVTDLNFSYKFTDKLSMMAMINNIFNIYPDETDPATKTSQAAHRFIYSSEVQQQGQLGRNFSLGINYKF